MHLEEIQPFLLDGNGVRTTPLIIYHNNIVPASLPLEKFGYPVEFMTKEELFVLNEKVDLDLNRFELSTNEAVVVFQYAKDRREGELTFKKSKGT